MLLKMELWVTVIFLRGENLGERIKKIIIGNK